MSAVQEGAKSPPVWSVVLKDISAFAWNIFLLVVVGMCLWHPEYIKDFRTRSGITGITGPGGWGIQLEKDLSDAQLKATALAVTPPSPHESEEPVPVEARNVPVDPQLKALVVKAQQDAPQIVPTGGWVFLGEADSQRQKFVTTSSTTTDAKLPVAIGNVLTVEDDVYVRAPTADRWHSSAPVTSVFRKGQALTVVDVDYSSAKNGGLYVWAKVRSN
ncbi:MAG TPA: hypothetical protein VGH80_07440 [Xanthomonadaceae bacterium]|jgi:hypothetical protein